MPDLKSILVTGSNGQLGQSLFNLVDNFPQFKFTFVSRKELDLSDLSQIEAYFQANSYDIILNCAAYTAVDKAESESDLANLINHLAVKKIAEMAKSQSAKLIHISTDYVYSGQGFRPYVETDPVSPDSVYGGTKLAGEQALLSVMSQNALLIRTSWVYSEYGSNFVKSMRALGTTRDSLNVIFDQIGTPTYALDLAQMIMKITLSEQFSQNNFNSEIYHFSNEGVCSWYDFAKTTFELSDIQCKVNPIETKDYPTPAKRPHYSLLNKQKIKTAFNVFIPHWRDSLHQCIKVLKDSKK